VFGTGVEEIYKSDTIRTTLWNQIIIWIFAAKSRNDVLTCLFCANRNKINVRQDVTLNLWRELGDVLAVIFRKCMRYTENNLFLLAVKMDRGRSRFSPRKVSLCFRLLRSDQTIANEV